LTGGAQSEIFLDAQHSQINEASILFVNSSTTGDMRIYGDGGDFQILGGGGRSMQIGSYNEFVIQGGRASSSLISQTNGTGGIYNTIITNSNDSIGLSVRANATQTSDLQQWTTSSGNVLASVSSLGEISINATTAALSKTTGSLTVNGGVGITGSVYGGNIYSNNYLVFGQDNYLATSTAASTSSSATPAVKTSITTGNVNGTYAVFASWQASSTNANRQYRVNTNIDGTVVMYELSSSAAAADVYTKNIFYTTNLTSGIHTLSLTYFCVNTNQTFTIQNARLWMYRIA
jgi:hypothetical protein